MAHRRRPHTAETAETFEMESRRRMTNGRSSTDAEVPIAAHGDKSQLCLCKNCPKIPQNLLYQDGEEQGGVTARLDKPFQYCDKGEPENIGRRVACQYGLLALIHVFEKAARLIEDDRLVNHARPPRSHHNVFNAHHDTGDIVEARFHPSGHEVDAAGRARGEQDSSIGQEQTTDPFRSNSQSTLNPVVLSEDERDALKNESSLGFWDQPWPFRATAFMLFIAASVQGWNQTATNGSNLCWLDPLIDDVFPRPSGDKCGDSTGYTVRYAVINAGPFLFAPVGCLLADPLNEMFMGRRLAIVFSAVLILGSAIGGAFTQKWWQLLVCRALLGVGMGGKASVTPVFAAEIAPPQLRGTLIMNWQVFDALGIFLGFTANLVAATAGYEDAWRWQVGSSILPALALIIALLLIGWDSPRFLMRHEHSYRERFENKKEAYRQRLLKVRRSTGSARRVSQSLHDPLPISEVNKLPFTYHVWSSIRYGYGPNPAYPYHSKAFDTLVILRGHELIAAKELIFMHCQMIIQRLASSTNAEQGEQSLDDINFSISPGRGVLRRYKDLFRGEGYLRRETVAAMTGMVGQQLCGINVLIFYSSRLFTRAGHSNNLIYGAPSRAPIWLSWGIGLSNFLFALPAYWWIESRGRRFLALATLPFLALWMTGAAACFSIGNSDPTSDSGAGSTAGGDKLVGRRIGVGIFSILFTIFYSPGMGPVPFTLAAEIFPLDYRLIGMSMASMVNFFLGGAFAVMVPFIPKEYILLGIFAGLNVVAYLLVWAFVREPETARPDTAPGEKPDDQVSPPKYLRLEEMFQIFEPSHREHIQYQRGRKSEAFKGFVDFCRSRPTRKKEYFRDWYDKKQESSDSSVRGSMDGSF